jgi:guanosine-3',5'-bis(diphosphate) 3'-pyrophosphohydrolase
MNIYIEGLDLAGKSTVSRRLRERCGNFEIRNNSLLRSNPLHQAADRLRKATQTDDLSLGYLYYGAMLYDLEQIRNEPTPDANVLQDSTILLRSLAFHTVSGNTALAEQFRSKLAEHPKFDRAFFLTCSPDVRKQRLAGRASRGNTNREDFLISSNPDLFFAMEGELRRLATEYFGAEVVDTGELESPQGSDRVLDSIISSFPATAAAPVPDVLWQRAAKMAARFHLHQVRKDGRTPYIAHPVRVALTLVEVFRITDPAVIAAALLHDLIEDTTADYDDIQAACGDDIARLVAALTKNSCLPETAREAAYHGQLKSSDWRAKLIKLADIYDNLCDSVESGAKVNVWRRAMGALEYADSDPRLAAAAAALRRLMETFPEESQSLSR